MNQNHVAREQDCKIRSLRVPIERIDRLTNGAIKPPRVHGSYRDKEEKIQRKIYGRLLAVQGNEELPVENATIEVHAVTPLKQVVNTLPDAVLAHCRTLVLERARPIDLYHPSRHVADMPQLSFVDVQRMHEIPGYELLVASARTQGDKYFRHLLGSNLPIARLLLCYYHPASFHAVHTANAVTDSVGLFQCAVLEQGDGYDEPGYLFVARQRISDNLYATLYRPTPATWYTHWNLAGNSYVSLCTRHPMVLRKKSPQ